MIMKKFKDINEKLKAWASVCPDRKLVFAGMCLAGAGVIFAAKEAPVTLIVAGLLVALLGYTNMKCRGDA